MNMCLLTCAGKQGRIYLFSLLLLSVWTSRHILHLSARVLLYGHAILVSRRHHYSDDCSLPRVVGSACRFFHSAERCSCACGPARSLTSPVLYVRQPSLQRRFSESSGCRLIVRLFGKFTCSFFLFSPSSPLRRIPALVCHPQLHKHRERETPAHTQREKKK